MEKQTNDNYGLLTRHPLKRVSKRDETENKNSPDKADSGDADKGHPERQREYVERRLKDIRAFEQRFSGDQDRSRKRIKGSAP